jgi:hypothetical protein
MSLLPLGILSSSGAGGGASFELISTTIMSSTATSVTIGSIPSTYKHLQVRFVAFGENGWPMIMKVNGSGSSIYSDHYLAGGGASVASGTISGASATQVYVFGRWAAFNGGTTIPVTGIIDILDYANTNKYKTINALSGTNNSSSEIGLYSAFWQSNTAINSITLTPIGNMYAPTRVSVYGVKGE